MLTAEKIVFGFPLLKIRIHFLHGDHLDAVATDACSNVRLYDSKASLEEEENKCDVRARVVRPFYCCGNVESVPYSRYLVVPPSINLPNVTKVVDRVFLLLFQQNDFKPHLNNGLDYLVIDESARGGSSSMLCLLPRRICRMWQHLSRHMSKRDLVKFFLTLIPVRPSALLTKFNLINPHLYTVAMREWTAHLMPTTRRSRRLTSMLAQLDTMQFVWRQYCQEIGDHKLHSLLIRAKSMHGDLATLGKYSGACRQHIRISCRLVLMCLQHASHLLVAHCREVVTDTGKRDDIFVDGAPDDKFNSVSGLQWYKKNLLTRLVVNRVKRGQTSGRHLHRTYSVVSDYGAAGKGAVRSSLGRAQRKITDIHDVERAWPDLHWVMLAVEDRSEPSLTLKDKQNPSWCKDCLIKVYRDGAVGLGFPCPRLRELAILVALGLYSTISPDSTRVLIFNPVSNPNVPRYECRPAKAVKTVVDTLNSICNSDHFFPSPGEKKEEPFVHDKRDTFNHPSTMESFVCDQDKGIVCNVNRVYITCCQPVVLRRDPAVSTKNWFSGLHKNDRSGSFTHYAYRIPGNVEQRTNTHRRGIPNLLLCESERYTSSVMRPLRYSQYAKLVSGIIVVNLNHCHDLNGITNIDALPAKLLGSHTMNCFRANDFPAISLNQPVPVLNSTRLSIKNAIWCCQQNCYMAVLPCNLHMSGILQMSKSMSTTCAKLLVEAVVRELYAQSEVDYELRDISAALEISNGSLVNFRTSRFVEVLVAMSRLACNGSYQKDVEHISQCILQDQILCYSNSIIGSAGRQCTVFTLGRPQIATLSKLFCCPDYRAPVHSSGHRGHGARNTDIDFKSRKANFISMIYGHSQHSKHTHSFVMDTLRALWRVLADDPSYCHNSDTLGLLAGCVSSARIRKTVRDSH